MVLSNQRNLRSSMGSKVSAQYRMLTLCYLSNICTYFLDKNVYVYNV